MKTVFFIILALIFLNINCFCLANDSDLKKQTKCINGNCYIKTENGKVGLLNDDKNIIIPIEYDYIESTSLKTIYILKKNNDYFLFNTDTSRYTDLLADNVKNLTGHYLLLEKNGKKGVFNLDENRLIIPQNFDSIGYYFINSKMGDVFMVEKNNRKGLLKKDGTVIYKPVFKNISIYSYWILLKNENDLYNIADIEYNIIAENLENVIIDTRNHIDSYYYYIVVKNNKSGIIRYNAKTKESKKTVDYIYDSINRDSIKFEKICFIAEKNGKFGIISADEGEKIVEFIYDSIEHLLFDEYYKFCLNGKCGFYNWENKQLSPIEYEDVRIKYVGDKFFIQVKHNGKWHYLKKAKVFKTRVAYTAKMTGVAIIAVVCAPFMLLLYYSM